MKTVDKAITETTDHAVAHVLKLAAILGDGHGPQAAKEFLGLFLSVFVGSTVKYSVEYPDGIQPEMSKEEKYALTRKSYQEQKNLIQNAIALGFTEAVSPPNEPMDYVCKIWLPTEQSKGLN